MAAPLPKATGKRKKVAVDDVRQWAPELDMPQMIVGDVMVDRKECTLSTCHSFFLFSGCVNGHMEHRVSVIENTLTKKAHRMLFETEEIPGEGGVVVCYRFQGWIRLKDGCETDMAGFREMIGMDLILMPIRSPQMIGELHRCYRNFINVLED